MFTPDGELREEYRELLDASEKKASEKKAEEPKAEEPKAAEAAPQAPAEKPDEEPEPEVPSGAAFADLVGLLAQGASVYLQQAAQGIENRREYLELARLHVDLLAILKHRTRGNLSVEEQSMLDQALSQLRMAMVRNG